MLVDETKSKIVLVEDRDEDAELTEFALKKSKFKGTVHRVIDGEEALKYLFQNVKDISDSVKLILLDLNIPKVRGLDVLKTIKKSEISIIPVVVLTTSKEESDIANAYKFYANSYVVKPVSFQEFQEKIAELRNYWLNTNCPPVN